MFACTKNLKRGPFCKGASREGRNDVRKVACYAVAIFAAALSFSLPTTAQVKRPPAAAPQIAPPAKFANLRDKLNQNTVTVISGNPNGTYLYLAYDMSAVLDDGDELRVLPVIGKGGYQNVMDVLHLRGVDLCITQSNIMTYLKETGEMGPNIENRLAFITRLYNEEMHVLAGPGINSIKELSGKKVNFSDIGSGTQFSTRQIFKLLGIQAQEVNMGQADGYQKVKSGEIAATVLIAGKPTGSFAKFKLEPGMKLLPVPYTEVLEQDYLPAKLTHADYPGLIAKDESVDSVAIASVLASYNWPRDTDRYRRVASFVDAFFTKFAEFQLPARHAKWKEANINSSLRGWKRFPAAEEWLAKNASKAVGAGVAIDPAIVRAQAAKAAPNDPVAQERLFQQFMEWSRSNANR
jgi:uncharacterized protein